MPTSAKRKLTRPEADAAHAAILHLVGSGSLTQALEGAANAPSSPAHALQMRVAQAYAYDASATGKENRLPVGARLLVIISASAALWAALGTLAYSMVYP